MRGIKLKDVTSKIGSGATPRGGKNAYKDQGLTLIRSQNVLDLDFNYDTAYIDDEQAEKLANVAVNPEDVLLNITGDSVARVCMVPDSVLPARVNQHVAIIRVDPIEYSSSYLLYYLQSIKPYLLSISEIGGTRRAITKGMIEELDIPDIDLIEQRAIAKTLSLLDAKIKLLHQQNQTLEALGAAVFREWFLEGEGVDIQLEEFIQINPRERLPKGEGACYLEMKGVSTNTSVPTGYYLRDFTSGTKFRNGDTLLARITPCLENGKTAFVSFLQEGTIGWGSTEFLVLRTHENYHPFWSYQLAKSTEFRGFAIKSMTGSSGRQRVQTDSLYQFSLVKPNSKTLHLANKVALRLSTKISKNAQQVATLTNLRNLLLPKLMSGEVTVRPD
ncbi:restriction endonuclease subunit S [Lewinella sp. 4G2]|uniref:restriction endonuclease subunit S n=1 Tax=Lewinella sp. 4G2 TaxID=1803372 RepID=UPI0007B48048|nr:restriction endonuclease subunit S [Lewinella sp. 4G2]OAV43959.1 restriction endonuclease subunit S [Lewinella sp. 4G2]